MKEAHWAACFDRVSGAQLNVDIMNARCRPRNPGKHSPNVSIASASRAPAPSSAGEAVTDLRSASSVRIDFFCEHLASSLRGSTKYRREAALTQIGGDETRKTSAKFLFRSVNKPKEETFLARRRTMLRFNK